LRDGNANKTKAQPVPVKAPVIQAPAVSDLAPKTQEVEKPAVKEPETKESSQTNPETLLAPISGEPAETTGD